MRNFAAFLIIAVALLPGIATTAAAYQHLSVYRIFSAELISITVGEQEVEAPASLILQIGASMEEAVEILIESDQDLSECKQNLEIIQDSSTGYIEIVIDQSARTMNGVLVLQCTAFYTPQ